jgi:hypothetical protein
MVKIKTKRYEASRRLRDALEENSPTVERKLALFREGLNIIKAHPEKFKIEGLGKKESRGQVTFSGLEEKDIILMKEIAKAAGLKSVSMVVRNAIESLIEKYKWEKFYKPQDWESKSLGVTVFPGGVNPNCRADPTHKKIAVGINLPPIVSGYLSEFIRSDPRDRFGYTMADFWREAIANCDWSNLRLLTKQEAFGKLRPITASIYVEQREQVVKYFEENPKFKEFSDVYLAIALQEISRRKKEIAS